MSQFRKISKDIIEKNHVMSVFHHQSTDVMILGIITFITGFLIFYFIGRRRFNRRNVTGLQQFKNYESALATIYLEKIFKLVGWLLTIIGLGLYLIS